MKNPPHLAARSVLFVGLESVSTSEASPLLFDAAGRQLFRRIWSLTWPLIVANALELMVGLIDLWLVRPLGPAATAALTVGRQVTFLVEAMAVAITAGVIALVSQGVASREQSILDLRCVVFGPDEV